MVLLCVGGIVDKVFEVRGKIASLGVPDRQGDVFSENLAFFTEPRIPVTIDFHENEVYGFAENITREDKSLWADIKLCLFHQHDDTIVNALSHLVPCIGGKTIERKDGKISKIRIDQIGLAQNNADPTIKSLKEQLNGK